jgi:predicted RND superfamily exporter protein
MWTKAASFILRNRIVIVILIAIITVFMGFNAQKAKMSYKHGGMLPESDTATVVYQYFKQTFTEDGNLIAIGTKFSTLNQLDRFKAWQQLGNDIKRINGVDSVFSVAHLYNLEKNIEKKSFDFKKISAAKNANQADIDSLFTQIKSLPFYQGLLFNEKSDATLMMVFVDAKKFNSEDRGTMIEDIRDLALGFEKEHQKIHLSGLPYVRGVVSKKIKSELSLFIGLAGLISAIILYFFFGQLKIVFMCLGVVGVGVVWSIGTIGLFGYEISVLMGLIPPLIIVIGIPNCVFLINKYHSEYVRHGNKIKALARTIEKIGNATFMTNTTTALGFATFIFTSSSILREFGVVASLNILAIFAISLCLIPIISSFLDEPKEKHTKHLERRWVERITEVLVIIVTKHRNKVYLTTIAVIVLGFIGLSLIQTTGNIVDDLPQKDPVLVDLKFLEKSFNGVMPFEIMIDTKKPKGATKEATLVKIEKLQNLLTEYPQFSRSLAITDAIKFAKQAFYNGNPEKYALLKGPEKSFIGPYLEGQSDKKGVSKTFVDSTQQFTRITLQIEDIGTIAMNNLLADLKPKVDSIFPPDKYTVYLTGTSVTYTKGTTYLVKNLFLSLCIAIVIIAFIMAFLFNSVRMVLASLIPNLLPLLVTAAIMGYFGIALKPSTILVFSIAFGISVDDTIHYLAKYRQELKANPYNLKSAIVKAIRETGVSMIYTSVILFFGFGAFAASQFGGTVALGVLVSVTLLVAMLTNLVLLPSFLMSYQRSLTTKSFKEEPLLQLLDEEDEVDLDSLEVKRNNNEDTKESQE